jgi:hypothetical protein
MTLARLKYTRAVTQTLLMCTEDGGSLSVWQKMVTLVRVTKFPCMYHHYDHHHHHHTSHQPFSFPDPPSQLGNTFRFVWLRMRGNYMDRTPLYYVFFLWMRVDGRKEWLHLLNKCFHGHQVWAFPWRPSNKRAIMSCNHLFKQHTLNFSMAEYLSHEHYIWNNSFIRDCFITTISCWNYSNNIRIYLVLKLLHFLAINFCFTLNSNKTHSYNF